MKLHLVFTVAGDDKLYVDGLLNKNLGQADDGSTNYNLKVNWMIYKFIYKIL